MMGPTQNRTTGDDSYQPVVNTVMTAIDYATAVLLLTGQITTTGVFMLPEGLSLSCTGPMLGGTRLEGTRTWARAALDGIDVLLALLLIFGEVSVNGPYVGYKSVYIVVGGPPFHVSTTKKRVGKTEKTKKSQTQRVYRQLRAELRRAVLSQET